VTPTVGPPTATPIGYSAFAGNGNVETDNFASPPNLSWVIEWEAQGTGTNTITVMLVDPEDGAEFIEIVNDSRTGQIGGSKLVVGNKGTFFLRVEGPESGWKTWIRQAVVSPGARTGTDTCT